MGDIEGKFGGTSGKFGGTSGKFGGTSGGRGLDRFTDRIGSLEARMDQMEGRIVCLEASIDRLAERIGEELDILHARLSSSTGTPAAKGEENDKVSDGNS
jgi:hypothetical protein